MRKVEQYLQEKTRTLDNKIHVLERQKNELQRRTHVFADFVFHKHSLIGNESELRLYNQRQPTISFKDLSFDFNDWHAERIHKILTPLSAFKEFDRALQHMLTHDPELKTDPVFSLLSAAWNTYTTTIEPNKSYLATVETKQLDAVKTYLQSNMHDIYRRKMLGTVYRSFLEGKDPVLHYMRSLKQTITQQEAADPFYQAMKIKTSDEGWQTHMATLQQDDPEAYAREKEQLGHHNL